VLSYCPTNFFILKAKYDLTADLFWEWIANCINKQLLRCTSTFVTPWNSICVSTDSMELQSRHMKKSDVKLKIQSNPRHMSDHTRSNWDTHEDNSWGLPNTSTCSFHRGKMYRASATTEGTVNVATIRRPTDTWRRQINILPRWEYIITWGIIIIIAR
jgi:hypothetical protein